MQKAKLVFYPYLGKKLKKTNQIPLYLRVSKGGVKVETSLGISIHADEFQHWNTSTERLEIKESGVNKKLEDIRDDFKGLQYRFKEEFPKMTPAQIKEKLFPTQQPTNSEALQVLDYLENHFSNTVKPNNNISDGTKRNYRKSINHFTSYLTYLNQTKITMAGFSPALAFGFYDYLQRDIVALEKSAMSDVSASSITIKIKAIFERAVDIELLNKNPFKKLRMQTKSPKRAELTIDEINALIKLDLTQSPKLDIYRDIFLFSALTGMAYSDVYHLKKIDIKEENGEKTIHKNRQKTDEPIQQVLVKQVVAILNKYEGHIETLPENRVFPKRHLNNVNESLKLLQAKAQISKNLSTHIARHTCNQLLRDLGSINSDVINKMLGWSNSKEGSSRFYSRINFQRLLDAKVKFQNFLDINLWSH